MENHDTGHNSPHETHQGHSPHQHVPAAHPTKSSHGQWQSELKLQFIILAVIAGGLYFVFHHNIGLACLVAVIAFAIGYMTSLLIVFMAEHDFVFTLMKKNEYKVVETGGMLKKYIGEAERWVETTGEVATLENKSDFAELKLFTPNPTTGKILQGRVPGLKGFLSNYLMNTFGVAIIGFPGIVSIKKFDLRFSTIENGKPKKKDFSGKNAVTTVFDSYAYMFRAESLNTTSESGSVPMFVEVTILFFVDNLHTPSYMAMPAGKWVSLAHEEFINIARAHVAQISYSDFFQEKIPDYDTLEEDVRKERVLDVITDAVKESMKGSLEAEILEAGDRFVSICGHRPYNVLIQDIDFEGGEELKKTIVQKAKAKETAKANLIQAEGEAAVEKTKIETAKHKRAQQLELSMSEVDANQAFVENVLDKITDNPDAHHTLRTKFISEMNNLSVLGGDASTIINPDKKEKGGK